MEEGVNKKKEECVLNKHPLDNMHSSAVGMTDAESKKSTVSSFTLLHPAPVCSKKGRSLGSSVDSYGSVFDVDSLAQNLCQGESVAATPFDGF